MGATSSAPKLCCVSFVPADPASFAGNNYDYLLARLLERRGARSEAASLYQALAGRSAILTQYALWHLALIGKDAGDLALERQYITRLLVSYPSSALAPKARERLIDSHFESGDYRATIALLRPIASTSGGGAQGDVPAGRSVFEDRRSRDGARTL